MLADLGFATSIEEANKVNAIFGTPYYTAPEMIKGKEFDSKIDVFSVGITTFFLLTGFFPFTGSSRLERNQKKLEIYHAICKGEMETNIEGWDIISD